MAKWTTFAKFQTLEKLYENKKYENKKTNT